MDTQFSAVLNPGQQHLAKPRALATRYALAMSMQTSKDIRRANLRMAVDHWLHQGKKQKEVALQLGVADSYLTQMLSGFRGIGDSAARKLESSLGMQRGALDAQWESWDSVAPSAPGRAHEAAKVEEPAATYAAIPVAAPNGDERSAEVNIPFFPRIRAAAGHGITNEHQGEPLHLKFREVSLRRRGINVASAMVIYAEGDSMEPLIGSGDTIMFDRSKTDIVDGKLYVIEVDDEALVKRLHRRPGGRVLVQSENPAYPAYEVPLQSDGFRVLGRVVWGAGWLD